MIEGMGQINLAKGGSAELCVFDRRHNVSITFELKQHDCKEGDEIPTTIMNRDMFPILKAINSAISESLGLKAEEVNKGQLEAMERYINHLEKLNARLLDMVHPAEYTQYTPDTTLHAEKLR